MRCRQQVSKRKPKPAFVNLPAAISTLFAQINAFLDFEQASVLCLQQRIATTKNLKLRAKKKWMGKVKERVKTGGIVKRPYHPKVCPNKGPSPLRSMFIC